MDYERHVFITGRMKSFFHFLLSAMALYSTWTIEPATQNILSPVVYPPHTVGIP